MSKHIVKNNRLKWFLACALVLSIITGTWVITQSSVTPVYADETDSTGSYVGANGVETKKTVVDNGDGSYTITLESYTTGKVTQETVSTPIDFVLVLDQSGSMNSNNLGDVTRQQAMINAINGTDSTQGFVDIVSEKSSEHSDNRVAIVTFSTSAATVLQWTFVKGNEDKIRNTVSSLKADGLTDTAGGMSKASELLNNLNYNGENTNRQKVVIFLSDGIARTGKVGQYSPQFAPTNADSAIKTAKTLKDAGVTIYTIGIFEDAKPELTYPADLSISATKWYGKANTSPINSIKKIEPGIGNRFCNYLSSNYLSADKLGLTYTESNSTNTQVYVTVDTKNTNYTRDSDQYFLTASDAGALANIFQTITEQVATPEIDLGSETVVQDVITPYFKIMDGSQVKVYTSDAADSTGTNDEWGARVEDNSLKPDIVGNTIRVTGFDYNANFVSETPKSDGSYGKKLIVEFTVIPLESFLGGTVATNITDNSGIIVKDEQENERIIQNFIPSPDFVSVPLKKIKPKGAEWNIYWTTEDKLVDMFKALTFTVDNTVVDDLDSLFNKTNNAGVNVTFWMNDSEGSKVYEYTVPAGETLGDRTKNMPTVFSDTNYTLYCKVEDKGNVSTTTTNTAEIKINVFKPVLTFSDKTVYYGEKVDLNNIEPTDVTWKWKSADGATEKSAVDDGVEMNTNEPTLTVTTISPADTGNINDNGYVSVKGDFSVNAEIGVGNQTMSIPNAFTIHVKTLSLSITKYVIGNFADKTKEFTFEITFQHDNLDNYKKEETFKLKNGEITEPLIELPIGAVFTIKETNIPNGYTVTAEVNGTFVTGSKTDYEKEFDYTITDTLTAGTNDQTTVEVTNELETIPNTGIDDGNPLFAYGIILFSGLGLIFLRIISRKKDR